MREIRRTVSLFSRIEQDVLEIALYQPGTLEPTTKRAGYTYAGELKELRLRGERLTQSLILDLWVQRANNERLPLRTRIELEPAQELNLLELLTPRDYYKLGSEIQLGLTLFRRSLGFQQALVIDGWADEIGYAVGSEAGSLGLSWGEISGVLDDQDDLVTALDNRASRAELDAYRDVTDAAIAALEDQVGAIDGLTQSEADALYRHQSALITAEDIEGPLLDSQIPQGITRDAELAQILGGYATTQALNAIAGVSQQQLDQAIASEAQARNTAIAALGDAIAAITKVPSPPIVGLINPVYLGHYSYYVAGISPQNPSSYQGPRIRRNKAVVRYTIHLASSLTAVIQPRFGGYCSGPSGETVAWRFIALPNITITPGVFVYENTYLIENIPNNFIGGLWHSLVSGSFTGFNSHVVEIWEGN